MQYATGVVDVFVNGVQVLSDGEHTGAKAGAGRSRSGLERVAGRRRVPVRSVGISVSFGWKAATQRPPLACTHRASTSSGL